MKQDFQEFFIVFQENNIYKKKSGESRSNPENPGVYFLLSLLSPTELLNDEVLSWEPEPEQNTLYKVDLKIHLMPP